MVQLTDCRSKLEVLEVQAVVAVEMVLAAVQLEQPAWQLLVKEITEALVGLSPVLALVVAVVALEVPEVPQALLVETVELDSFLQ